MLVLNPLKVHSKQTLQTRLRGYLVLRKNLTRAVGDLPGGRFPQNGLFWRRISIGRPVARTNPIDCG
jgi:hypothetical protein